MPEKFLRFQLQYGEKLGTGEISYFSFLFHDISFNITHQLIKTNRHTE